MLSEGHTPKCPQIVHSFTVYVRGASPFPYFFGNPSLIVTRNRGTLGEVTWGGSLIISLHQIWSDILRGEVFPCGPFFQGKYYHWAQYRQGIVNRAPLLTLISEWNYCCDDCPPLGSTGNLMKASRSETAWLGWLSECGIVHLGGPNVGLVIFSIPVGVDNHSNRSLY